MMTIKLSLYCLSFLSYSKITDSNVQIVIVSQVRGGKQKWRKRIGILPEHEEYSPQEQYKYSGSHQHKLDVKYIYIYSPCTCHSFNCMWSRLCDMLHRNSYIFGSSVRFTICLVSVLKEYVGE